LGRPPAAAPARGADRAVHQLPQLRRADLLGGDVVEHRSLPALRARSAAADQDPCRYRWIAPAAASGGADRVGDHRPQAFARALGVSARATPRPDTTPVAGPAAGSGGDPADGPAVRCRSRSRRAPTADQRQHARHGLAPRHLHLQPAVALNWMRRPESAIANPSEEITVSPAYCCAVASVSQVERQKTGMDDQEESDPPIESRLRAPECDRRRPHRPRARASSLAIV
jgi:hypothetical protein